MSKAGGQGEAPVVQPTTVAAAGLASTSAAVVTSSVGVAGTILGAAITTMIITGGSAMIRVGMERTTGTVRKTTKRIRERNVAEDAEPTPPPYPPAREGDHPPQRPDLRDNLMGRLRAGLGKFPRLPERRRRSVIMGTAIASLVAFIVAMATVTGAELAVGKTLSCWVWGNCPTATAAGGENLNTRPSIFGGGQSQTTPGGVPLDQQQGIPQEGLPEAEEPAGGQEVPQDTPSQELPQEQPATPIPEQQELPQEQPVTPVPDQQEVPQEQPATPVPDQQEVPQELPQE